MARNGGVTQTRPVVLAIALSLVCDQHSFREGKFQIEVRGEFNGLTAAASIAQANFMTAAAAAQASQTSGASVSAGGGAMPGFSLTHTLNLTQNGTAISGDYRAMGGVTGGTVVTLAGPISGTVRATAPQVVFNVSVSVTPAGIFAPWTDTYMLTPSSDGNTFTGTVTSSGGPVPGTYTGSITRR